MKRLTFTVVVEDDYTTRTAVMKNLTYDLIEATNARARADSMGVLQITSKVGRIRKLAAS